MEKEIEEKYNKAKSVSDNILVFAKNIVKEGASVLKIAEEIEKNIEILGAKPAFPVNISINENAAHYTPDIDETTTLKAGDLVKIDFGVHIDGYIWDRAFTVYLGDERHPLIEASNKALSEALKSIKPGVKVCEISEIVEDTIREFGFNPVRNLCGHGLEKFNQHAHPSIPNGKNSIKEEIKEGQVIAMEVFVTDGSGFVKESKPILIYRFRQRKAVRLFESRVILKKAEEDFKKLPFARRWLKNITTPVKIDLALRELINTESIFGYPILKEKSKGMVAQAEETIIVK